MAMIYVKTKPGRKAYFEGRIIPNDKFVAVTDDPYIRRLIDHWEDLEVQGSTPAAGAKPAAKGPAPTTAPSPRSTVQPPPTPAPATGAPKPQN